MSSGEQRVNRLRWLCRRGMKELDLILEVFIAREQGALSSGGFPLLEKLLASEDDELWDWLQGRAAHDDPELQALVDVIRG